MILATIAVAFALGAGRVDDNSVKCAVMGSPTKLTASKASEYAGARFPFCCGGCNATFNHDPKKFLAQAEKQGSTIGVFLFCPVSGEKLDWDKVKVTSDYKGLRYGFCCADCKGAFDKDPAKYTKTPDKESLVCPVSGDKISSYSAAAGFMDYEGVRYYTCCKDCLPALQKDPAKVLAAGKAKVSSPVAMNATNAKPHGG